MSTERFSPDASLEESDIILAEQALAAARLEGRVPKGVERLRRLFLREAISCAEAALYHWVARGVEWYHATCGWIYLLDEDRNVLRPIPGTVVRSLNRLEEIPLDSPRGSFMARVCKEGRGDFTNDVDVSMRANEYHIIDSRTKSELAVPLFDENGPEGRRVIGIYNLESDTKGRFFPAQVREIQRNTAILTLHLLVIRDWLARRDTRPWVWHPEIHGWSPNVLMERFCHTVAKLIAGREGILPSCSVWNVDAKSQRCWTLGTSGFDYDFLSQYALGPSSAVGKAASGSRRVVARGTPKEVGFQYLTKAQEMKVREAAIVSIPGFLGEGIRGTFNLYSLDSRTTLPTSRLVIRLAAHAERFLATVNRQRIPFAKAYIRQQLAKSADPNPDFRFLRKAIMKVLPVDALSIFVPKADEQGHERMHCVDGTGFEKDLADVWYPIEDPPGNITAHCYLHPGEAVRVNFGPNDAEVKMTGLPPPSSAYPETIATEDSDFGLRRRLGIGVPSEPGSKRPALGVIRLYRSAKGRPFTEADRELLRSIGTSWECCGCLFANLRRQPEVTPHVFSPPLILVRERLRKKILKLRDLSFKECQGDIFIRGDENQHCYLRYISYPHDWAPDDIRYEPSESFGEAWKHPEDIIVKAGKPRGGEAGTCICVPLSAWDESHYVRGICSIDLGSSVEDEGSLLRQVFEAAVWPWVYFSKNLWEQKMESDGDVLKEFPDYVASVEHVSRETAPRLFLVKPEPASLPRLVLCSDPELRAAKVLTTEGGSHCLIPLPVGPVPAAWLWCQVEKGLPERNLRNTVGLITGAWSRVVVAALQLWNNVRFQQKRTSRKTKIWKVIFEWDSPGRHQGI